MRGGPTFAPWWDMLPVARPALPFAIGDVVAGYRIDRFIGVGGMGVVASARRVSDDAHVAVKCLLPKPAKRPDIVARFVREGQAAGRITSDHVVRVLDVGTTSSGLPFMAMEYLEGVDLAILLDRERRLPVGTAVAYVLQACHALAEAHSLGIIHRDLKPANLFVTRRPDGGAHVKLLDFGISKELDVPEGEALTGTSMMMGSPKYMPPEQIISARRVDARSDVWSMGVILYELLSGELPFRERTMTALIEQIVKEAPAPLMLAAPDVPPALAAIVERCLAKNPAQRVQSIAELASLIVPFASIGPVAASTGPVALVGGPASESLSVSMRCDLDAVPARPLTTGPTSTSPVSIDVSLSASPLSAAMPSSRSRTDVDGGTQPTMTGETGTVPCLPVAATPPLTSTLPLATIAAGRPSSAPRVEPAPPPGSWPLRPLVARSGIVPCPPPIAVAAPHRSSSSRHRSRRGRRYPRRGTPAELVHRWTWRLRDVEKQVNERLPRALPARVLVTAWFVTTMMLLTLAVLLHARRASAQEQEGCKLASSCASPSLVTTPASR